MGVVCALGLLSGAAWGQEQAVWQMPVSRIPRLPRVATRPQPIVAPEITAGKERRSEIPLKYDVRKKQSCG